ncbi:MAG: HisA/HisF-related TIM barrel protein [Firmicutes bacterium]|nr:HisA/HisF-related TIM barrel protein [Bacillota bacterium]
MREFCIIPRIEVNGGKTAGTGEACAETAYRLYCDGADGILLHNTDYTSAGVAAMCAAVAAVTERVFVPVRVSGAVFETAQIRILISEGADRVFYNTAAVYSPWRIDESAGRLGSRYVGIAVNCRKIPETSNREVLLNNGAVSSGKDALLWVYEAQRRGASELLLCAMPQDESEVFDTFAVRQIIGEIQSPVLLLGDFVTAADFAGAAKAGACAAVSDIFVRGGESIYKIKRELADMGLSLRL